MNRPHQSRSGETILVIEDEDAVRFLVSRVLQRQGYRVLEAANGREALASAVSHDGPIHLVLSDVVLPDLAAAEIVGRVKARKTMTKALFMSGHSGAVLMRDGLLEDGAHFIQKPFTGRAFADKVREVLDA